MEHAPVHTHMNGTRILPGSLNGRAAGLEDLPLALLASHGVLLPAHPSSQGCWLPCGQQGPCLVMLLTPRDEEVRGDHPYGPHRDGHTGKLQHQAFGWMSGGKKVGEMGRPSLVQYCACSAGPVTLFLSLSPSRWSRGATSRSENRRSVRLGPSPHCPTTPFVSS